MSNPFEGKSLAQLRDDVPGLSNAELDALAACVCDGYYVSHNGGGFWVFNGTYFEAMHRHTTDWREAGRLLVKYKLHLEPCRFHEEWWAHDYECHATSRGDTQDPRRAITEAAVIAELTQRIEAVPQIKISEAPPVNITGGMDSVEYVRKIRSGESFEGDGDEFKL